MSELLFGFKDIVNSSPNKSVFNLSSFIIQDSYLRSFNPKRYKFYVKFMNGLSNPEVLENFLYKVKETKETKANLDDKLLKLTGLLSNLYNNDDSDKIIKDVKETIKNKYNLSDNAEELVEKMLKKGGDEDGKKTKKEISPEIKKQIMQGTIKKGDVPMRDFLTTVKSIAPQVGLEPPPENIIDLVDTDGSKSKGKTKLTTDELKKLQGVYNQYNETYALNPERLDITMIDRLIFIAITFIIRYISLLIISWGLNTNIINTFNTAFFYYCIIYILFFVFITTIVNVVIFYPVMELFSSLKIISIPNMLYYFYIYTNGSLRLLIHIFFILMLLFLPYIINIDKVRFYKLEEKTKNISYDYDKKKKIYDTLSLFSIIVWVLTSIIATKF
jgi:hypothetical protein